MKNEKGITLMALTLYLIFVAFIIMLLFSLTKNITSGTSSISQSTAGVGSFNSFNTNFVIDVKNSDTATVETDANNNIRISLTNGSIYTFVKEEQTIYRNSVKIAKNITNFSAEVEEGTKDNIIVRITVGNEQSYSYGKAIRYVFKY